MPELVSILAGGWSARAYDLQRLPGFVIGVNESGLLARCDAIVSMDRLWTENRWSRLHALGRPAWIREAALKNIPPHFPAWLNRFDCDHAAAELSDDLGVLNGPNSGHCALNLAYQLRPRTIRLYGMDMSRGPDGEGHWYANYEWAKPGGATGNGKFAEWRAGLAQAVAQCAAAGIAVETMAGTECAT